MTYAPVGIVTLNRYEHFKQCLESLERCTGADQTEVYVALDYPPSEKYVEGWKRIDSYLEEKELNNKFKKLIVYRRDHNYGIKGVNSNGGTLHIKLCEEYDYYIISEDDNVFSPNYLEYMNQCLEKYKDDEDVIAVTGYSYPINWESSKGATVQRQNFNASAWGWGWWTCKRNEVRKNISTGDMYDRAPELLKNGTFRKRSLFVTFYEYVSSSIIPIDFYKKVQNGRLAITDYCTRQYLAVYDKYVISPLISKVRNIGFDGTGVYCQDVSEFDGSGTTAWNTDYSKQIIDEKTTFEIVENDASFLDENRSRLDKFEWRPIKLHIIANCIAFGIRMFGLSFMRKFTTIVFKVWNRRIK